MQQSRGLQRIVACMAFMAMLVLAGCADDDPEKEVRAQVEAMQAAIDARDAGDVEDLLADDFVGNDGMDRRAIRQLAAAVFLRHREVAAKLGPVAVELRGDSDAIARFSVIATAGVRRPPSGNRAGLPGRNRLAPRRRRVEAAQRKLDAEPVAQPIECRRLDRRACAACRARRRAPEPCARGRGFRPTTGLGCRRPGGELPQHVLQQAAVVGEAARLRGTAARAGERPSAGREGGASAPPPV